METTLTVSIDDHNIARVMLNRPERHNAFNATMIAELTALFTELDRDPHVRLVVLSGSGESFCSGADTQWMLSVKNYSPQENMEDGFRMAEMFERLNNFSKPLIGRVHGNALAGGIGFVAVCDYVLAEASAVFGFTEVRVGLVPAVISPHVIDKIGESAARAYFTSGIRFSAEHAREMHLVHEVVSGTKALDARVEEVIAAYLKAAPEATCKAKALIANVVDLKRISRANREGKLMQYTVQAIANARVSPEGQQGMAALLSGGTPPWVKK
ncbi:MAG: enoyl-CoA hydratase/isomerase family protein [Alphaproteobacteria bacterium]|nr:enoyl-CoA hydratase/isomerase family protein [Alphaproteobacteria bacterium]